MKPTILHYPIPGNDRGGLLHIYGDRKTSNSKCSNVILYCGGWPDGVEPFTPLAQRLATSSTGGGDGDDGEEGCFVGITCWPGFDYESYRQTKFRGFRREGYSSEEVTYCIREAAKQLFAEYNKQSTEDIYGDDESSKKEPQFTVIFHDWGVAPGLMYVNRSIEEKEFTQHMPDRVVLLDVLTGLHPKFKRPTYLRTIAPHTRHEILVYLAYRGAFACSYAMLRYASETIGLIAFGIMSGFIKLLRLWPMGVIDSKMLAERKMNLYHLVYTMYPYYNMFQSLFFDRKAFYHMWLPLDLVQTPVLFIYGSEKPVMLHDHRSFTILEREEREGTSDCRVVKVDGAGHWMYCQRPDVCEIEIRKFLNCGNRDLRNDDRSEMTTPHSRL